MAVGKYCYRSGDNQIEAVIYEELFLINLIKFLPEKKQR